MANSMKNAIGRQPLGHKKEGLPEILERILDKGVVVDLKARVQLYDIKLLGLRALTIISGFDTAHQVNLALPSGIDRQKWKRAHKSKCPQCGKRIMGGITADEQCPWCGFRF